MSAKKQSSIDKYITSKRKPKEITETPKETPTKKVKGSSTKKDAKKSKSVVEEEKKEIVDTKDLTTISKDVNSDPLNSYEDFVGHLGDWQEPLKNYLKTPHFKSIYDYVVQEYKTTKCYPPKELIFNAFKKTQFKDVKVVIVGQDPYIKANEAMGLCFSIPKTTKCPPSLQNIYKALNKDPDVKFSTPSPLHGDLQSWASQGVLMLNAVLTVREGVSFSHAKSGWAKFTNEVIKAINSQKEGVVFLCWGGKAQEICKDVNTGKHHVLKYGHPSPLAQKTQKFEN